MSTSIAIANRNSLSTNKGPTNIMRKISLAAGIFYIITFVSIPTLTFYDPMHQPNYLIGAGNDNRIIIGGILEIIVALSGITTAIILYPVLKRQNEILALGLVAARILEAATIFVGVAFVLTIVTLHANGAGAQSSITGQALIVLYDRIFSLGQGFIPALDDLLLGILLYQSRLVPRALSIVGIVGALPLIAGCFAILFGLIDRISPFAVLSAVPVAVFEFSLGIYLIVNGFKASAIVTIKNKNYITSAK